MAELKITDLRRNIGLNWKFLFEVLNIKPFFKAFKKRNAIANIHSEF